MFTLICILIIFSVIECLQSYTLFDVIKNNAKNFMCKNNYRNNLTTLRHIADFFSNTGTGSKAPGLRFLTTRVTTIAVTTHQLRIICCSVKNLVTPRLALQSGYGHRNCPSVTLTIPFKACIFCNMQTKININNTNNKNK